MDVFRGAKALSVVIYAILNRAIDSLDVLFALAISVHHKFHSLSTLALAVALATVFMARLFADNLIIPRAQTKYLNFQR